MTPAIFAVLGVVGFLAGFVKAAFGIGSGVLFAPVMALFMEPKMAVGLTAPMMLITDLTTIHVYWRRWDWGVLKQLLPAALIGIVVGTQVLVWAPAGQVRKAIGLIALAFALTQIYRLWRGAAAPGSQPAPGGRWGLVASLVGACGGVASAIAHSGGIVFSFYLLPRLTKIAFVASLALTLLVSDTAKMLSFWQAGVVAWPELLAGCLLAPVMFGGTWLGGKVNGKLSDRLFLVLVTGLVMVTGVALLLR